MGRGLGAALALWSSTLHAVEIRGVVLDNFTGRPLARSVVTLSVIQGYGSANVTVRSDRGGVFSFLSVPAGGYLLTAARPGFAVLKYGQRAWNAPGIPIFVEQDASQFLQLRLQRMAAITGTVWDENEIGFPEVQVVAYHATRPPKIAAKGKTDDRGVYRIGDLLPGRYFIRTAGKQMDEDGLLPTFYKEVAAVDDATVVQVRLEEQATDINVRPIFGKVYRLSGTVGPPPAHLTLVSDMGEMTATTTGAGNFTFENLAPGPYELIAIGPAGAMQYGGYWKLEIDRDMERDFGMEPARRVQLTIEDEGGKRIDPKRVPVFVRRKTLAGEGPPVKLGDTILPGRWEAHVVTPPNQYLVSIGQPGRSLPTSGHALDWLEFVVAYVMNFVRVVVSSHPAALHGKVAGTGSDPVAGAPVYLEAIDPNTQKRVAEVIATRTNARGEYRFSSLAPGTYRIVSTFEFEDPDEETINAARPRTVTLKESSDSMQDLDLYTR